MSFIKDLVKGKAEYKNGRVVRHKKKDKKIKHDSSSDSDSDKKSKKSKKKRESLYERTGIGAPSSKDKYYKREKLTLLESDKKRIKDMEKKQKKDKKLLQIKKLLEYNNKMDKVDKLLNRIAQLEKPLSREEAQAAQGAERPKRGFLSRYFEPSIGTPSIANDKPPMSNVIRPMSFRLDQERIDPPNSASFPRLGNARPTPVQIFQPRGEYATRLTPTTPLTSTSYHVPNISPSPYSRPSVQ